MALETKRNTKNNTIWSHLRQDWYHETPEERVRQEYLCVLVNEYDFSLEQIGEEIPVTQRGSAQARADFLIRRSAADKAEKKTPLIVVECKADNITIDARTYTQGANYAQYCKARFFVTHNNRETKYWKVDHAKMMPTLSKNRCLLFWRRHPMGQDNRGQEFTGLGHGRKNYPRRPSK